MNRPVKPGDGKITRAARVLQLPAVPDASDGGSPPPLRRPTGGPSQIVASRPVSIGEPWHKNPEAVPHYARGSNIGALASKPKQADPQESTDRPLPAHCFHG